MSEESSKRNRRTKRIAAQQNKPVLVTGDMEQDTTVATASTETELMEDVDSEEVLSASETKPVQPRRGFFSTIGRHTDNSENHHIDAVQARLARAVRKKDKQQTASAEEGKPEEERAEKKPVRTAASRAPQRPASPFKLRYILGMFLYLIIAELLGGYEVAYVHNSSMERVLARFDLFGSPATISTSTVVYLVTLIILLVVLARFDLIPRSLSGAASQGQQTQRRTSSQDNEPAPKFTPPPVRQGIKGESDDLYRQYRDSKRR
ncbi:MAG TPA: hypothetical protein VH593_23025, partial [Ktedonobacteraceae bacterium]